MGYNYFSNIAKRHLKRHIYPNSPDDIERRALRLSMNMAAETFGNRSGADRARFVMENLERLTREWKRELKCHA